ncbi:MAG: hypothetical protein N2560_09870 [Ignavibacteria bacterium]|nr:hypothetical protein [Ignavibacteria bacterium]
MKNLFYCLFSIVLLTNLSFAQNITPKQTNITIYQNNYATVQQEIEFTLNNIPSYLTFTFPSLNIVSSSIMINFNGEVLEQNFSTTINTLDSWLKNSIGKELTLIGPNGLSYKGKLSLLTSDELIVNTEDKKTVYVTDLEGFTLLFNNHEFIQPEKTKVTWLLKPNKTGKNNGTLLYHISGLNWQGKYYLYLDDEKKRLNLIVWAVISNQSGMDFENVNLKIIEGELNIYSIFQTFASIEALSGNEDSRKMVMGSFEPQKEIFEYFQYSYPQKTNLKDYEIKQLKLNSAENVPYKKTYSYDLSPYPALNTKEKPSVNISFVNNKQNNLGFLFPKGQADIYIVDNNNYNLIGQSSIKTTPIGDEININIGKVTDMAVEVKKAETIKISQNLIERRFLVVCYNFKNQDTKIDINFTEQLSFELTKSNIQPKIKDVSKLVFEVPVKANSSSELNFTIQVKQ